MPSIRFVLAASHAGEERDLWRLVREPNQVVEWTAKVPRYHHTMKNGERPHFTAQDGIDSPTSPVHPSLAATLMEAHPDVEKVKHHPIGWPIDWSEVENYEALSGIAFHYPSDFEQLDPQSASKRWDRQVVPLEVGQGVQAHHYLARPTEVTKQHLAMLREMPDTFELVVIDRWEPWSVIHVQRTKPLAEQRIHPSGGVGS